MEKVTLRMERSMPGRPSGLGHGRRGPTRASTRRLQHEHRGEHEHRWPRGSRDRRCDDRRVPLNHVALTVGDRERSAAFYARHFGLTERVHDDERLLIVGSPDGSLLALSEGPVPEGLPRTNHFGFRRDDPGEVREARRQLREAGVPETEWQDDHGFVRVQVADPDGYRVELFALAGAAPPPRPSRSRWTSFVADAHYEPPRILSERGNRAHRLRVEHNRDTLLVHLSGEAGGDWTVLAVDRATRRWAVAQAHRQLDAARRAYERLYAG
jgi:catechol 2,3-dioxygenase-like lactoylglutathione lyase family enzyme